MAAAESRVTVYVTRRCGYCHLAMDLLRARGIAFRAIDLTDDDDARDALVERTQWRTMPVVLIDDELVGGHRELVQLDRTGELARRVSSG